MASVPPTAYYSHLDDVAGIVLKTDAGVFFQDATTGTWTTLTRADAPRLLLLGHLPTADAQALVDGNLLHKAAYGR